MCSHIVAFMSAVGRSFFGRFDRGREQRPLPIGSGNRLFSAVRICTRRRFVSRRCIGSSFGDQMLCYLNFRARDDQRKFWRRPRQHHVEASRGCWTSNQHICDQPDGLYYFGSRGRKISGPAVINRTGHRDGELGSWPCRVRSFPYSFVGDLNSPQILDYLWIHPHRLFGIEKRPRGSGGLFVIARPEVILHPAAKPCPACEFQ